MEWPVGDSNESPNSQRGFSTVGGGNSNDYLPYVNYGKRLSGSSLVIVLSWEGTVLAQPCRGSPYTRAGRHSGRDSKGYLCIALDPLFCRAPSLPGTLPTNSSTLNSPWTLISVSSDPTSFPFPAPSGRVLPAPPSGNCQREKCGP